MAKKQKQKIEVSKQVKFNGDSGGLVITKMNDKTLRIEADCGSSYDLGVEEIDDLSDALSEAASSDSEYDSNY